LKYRGPAVPYRRRLTGSFLAHLFKATAQQHHRALAATIARFVPAEAVVFDVGAHAGQYTKLFARTASAGRVYAVEPGSYYFRGATFFETGAARYGWITKCIVVCTGEREPAGVKLNFYKVP